MTPLHSRTVLLVAAIGAAPLAAERAAADELPVLVIADSSDDRVVRLADLDGSGAYEPGEATVFFDDTNALAVELSVPSHVLSGPDESVWLLDGGTVDAILVLEDRNGDGDANDAEEARVFYDATGAGPALATPNTVVAMPDGALLVADDGSRARHLLRLEDLDGDGTALGPDEARVVFDASNVDGILIDDPESLAVAPSGEVWVGESATGRIWLLRDLDGDDAYQSPGEAGLFHESSKPSALTDIDTLAVLGDGRLLAIDEDSGLVLALRDLDGDRRAEGAEEVEVWIDAAVTLPLRDPNDATLSPTGALFVVDGSRDAVLEVVDLDGDGLALSDGEIRSVLADDGETLSTPSAVAILAHTPDPPSTEGFVRGDANSDGAANLADAVSILEFLFLGRGTPACADALDTDDTGVIGITDAVYLLNYLSLGGPSLPPPFPGPGEDPTDDALGCEVTAE